MANFIPSKKTADDFNNGVAYVNGDAVQAETVNNLVESALYTQEAVEQNTTDLQEGIDTLTSTVNTGIQQAKSIADSAVDIANDAMDKIDDAISGGVSGVKGNNETTYRTGQVNLTSANIGAMPTSGGTFTGNITAPLVTGTNAVYDGDKRVWSAGNRPTAYRYSVGNVIEVTDQTDTVVGYYKNSTGGAWYRIWSSGWKEMGGYTAVGASATKTTAIIFPFPFYSMPTVVLGIHGQDSTSGTLQTGISAKSTTQFTYIARTSANSEINNFDWYACGY